MSRRSEEKRRLKRKALAKERRRMANEAHVAHKEKQAEFFASVKRHNALARIKARENQGMTFVGSSRVRRDTGGEK